MIKNHYDKHLGNYFTWIYGGHNGKVKENELFFQNHSIKPQSTKVAVDLGSGVGFQSIPLAKMGFNVTAVDFSKKMISELKEKSKDLNIEIVEDDITNFEKYNGRNPELIVCMGDVLTHLRDKKSVNELIKNCYNELVANGKLILSFRDLSFQLEGIDRFIPIRNDDEKIFTCFLEYENGKVHVYDIVHEREEGKWFQKISSYTKIAIDPEEIKNMVESAGFNIVFFEDKNDIINLIAEKK